MCHSASGLVHSYVKKVPAKKQQQKNRHVFFRLASKDNGIVSVFALKSGDTNEKFCSEFLEIEIYFALIRPALENKKSFFLNVTQFEWQNQFLQNKCFTS